MKWRGGVRLNISLAGFKSAKSGEMKEHNYGSDLLMPDFELLFTCMFIIGGGLYWMLRMAGVEIGSRDCDQCGRPTGVTWGSDAYYCSYTCASYAGDFSVRDGWKVEKLHHETPM